MIWTALGWRGGGGTGGNGAAVKRPKPSERLRIPQPLIKSRLPSGRGAMEQPNVTGDGDATLTPFFWLLVLATGVGTGLLGDAMMVVLFNVQHVAYGYSLGSFFHVGNFETAVDHVPAIRRVIVLMVAGAFGGVAWFLLRRFTTGEKSDLDDVIWHGGRLSFRRSLGTGIISEIVIALGASLGREQAPKLLGGVTGSLLGDWARLSPAQKRLLIACGGGAGLGAVYNVPLGGALFTAEVLLGNLTLPVVLPALACSVVATGTSYLYLPARATYADIPQFHFGWPLLAWAFLAGPLIGVIAVGYIRLIGWVSHHAIGGRSVMVSVFAAMTVLGLLGIQYPQLFGNGKDMAHDAFVGAGGSGLMLILFALKPLVTSMCIGSGASGGLFTPTMSTGAVLGAGLGILWSIAWPGSPSGAYAMIGAAAMLGAGMQAPLASLVLVVELTYSGFQIIIPMVIATVIATVVARYLDGYSIYSARLRARPLAAGSPSPGGDGEPHPDGRAAPDAPASQRGHDGPARGDRE